MNFQILIILILASASVSAFLSPETARQNLLGNRELPLNATPKTEKGQRKPWEFFRFVSQSSKFVPSPFQSKPPLRVVQPGDILWRPESPSNEFSFAPLDDVVMGGASASNFDNASGIWRGRVTDANNGGFVGIRNTPYVQWDMRSNNCRGLELKLRSKGKSGRFKVGIRDSVDFNGIVWNSSVDVQTKATTVRNLLHTPVLFTDSPDGTAEKILSLDNTERTYTISYRHLRFVYR